MIRGVGDMLWLENNVFFVMVEKMVFFFRSEKFTEFAKFQTTSDNAKEMAAEQLSDTAISSRAGSSHRL